MAYKYVVCLFLVLVLSTSFKKRGCPYLLYYKNYSIILNTNKGNAIKQNKKLRFALTGDTLVVAHIFDCMGKSTIDIFVKKKLRIQSSFRNGVINEGVLNAFNRRINDYCDYSNYHIIPIKEGIWKYYDEKANLIKTETWENGSLTSK